MGLTMSGFSGIDTESMIAQLVQLEQQKVHDVAAKKEDYQVKIDAYSELDSKIDDLESVAADLRDRDTFSIYSTSSSSEDHVSFTADSTASEGRYSVEVFNRAQAEKMVTTEGLITDMSTSLTDLGVNEGTFSIDGVEITLDAGDNIKDLKSKINNAVDTDGNPIDVTATIIEAAENDYRLVLSSDDTGEQGAEYLDLNGGTTLQDLGVILDASGTKGNTNQVVSTNDDIRSAFEGLAPGEEIKYSGIDSAGNQVSGSFTKDTDSTVEDLIKNVDETFNGTATVSVDSVADGGELKLTAKNSGPSQLSLDSFSMGGTDYGTFVEQVGVRGEGVLSEGRDSYFSIDGLNMQDSKNSVTDRIEGITLELNKRTSENGPVELAVEKDYNAIGDKVKELLSAYNSVVDFVKTETKYGTSEDEEDGKLAGDMSARSILARLQQKFQGISNPSAESAYENLSMIGMETSTETGKINLNEGTFNTALKESFNDVVNLFVTRGHSENTDVKMGRYTKDTTDGNYELREVDAEHYEIRRVTSEGTSDWYTSDARSGDTLFFTDAGPASGLALEIPEGTGDTTFNFSNGLAGHLNNAAENLTRSDGMINGRQDSMRSSIKRIDDRVDRMNRSVESYRERLVKQFAAMEEAIAEIQSQGDSMMNQLGA